MNIAQRILILLLRLYQYTVSPAKTFLFGPLGRCRFTPTCSVYAIEAVRTHGALAGGWLAIKRICRCQPWGDCGWDPVPSKSATMPLPEPSPAESNEPAPASPARWAAAPHSH